jgi:hypothetical protein
VNPVGIAVVVGAGVVGVVVVGGGGGGGKHAPIGPDVRTFFTAFRSSRPSTCILSQISHRTEVIAQAEIREEHTILYDVPSIHALLSENCRGQAAPSDIGRGGHTAMMGTPRSAHVHLRVLWAFR